MGIWLRRLSSEALAVPVEGDRPQLRQTAHLSLRRPETGYPASGPQRAANGLAILVGDERPRGNSHLDQALLALLRHGLRRAGDPRLLVNAENSIDEEASVNWSLEA